MIVFRLILTTFESSSIGGSWGSIKIWLEPKIEPPSENLACPDLWNALYMKIRVCVSERRCYVFTINWTRDKCLHYRGRTSTIHRVRRDRSVAELLLEDGLHGQMLGSAPLSRMHRSQPVLCQQATPSGAGVRAVAVHATKRLSKHYCWW